MLDHWRMLSIVTCWVLALHICAGHLAHEHDLNSIAAKEAIYDFATSNNYTIREGTLTFLVNSSAFGANPSSVYGVYLFSFEEGAPFFNFFSRDALIFAGVTPPASKYYGYRSYLFTRRNPPNTRRKETLLFASLGDTLNNMVINTSNSSDVFNAFTIVITTGDGVTYNAIRNHIIEKKPNLSNTINLDSLPADYVYFQDYHNRSFNVGDIKHGELGSEELDTDLDVDVGLNDTTVDRIGMMIRIALPDNETEYLNYIGSNQTIYWLTPADNVTIDANDNRIPREPIGVKLRNLSSNVNEYKLINSTVYNQFTDSVLSYFTQTKKYKLVETLNLTQFYHKPDSYYGFNCINNNKDCLGDNRDALYWYISTRDKSYDLVLNESLYYIVLGMNHQMTNKSTYSNIAFYEQNGAAGIDYVPLTGINNFEFEGSGLVLPIDRKNKPGLTDQFLNCTMVVQAARPDNCIKNLPGWCLSDKQFADGLKFTFAARDYLCPQTKTRPDPTEIIHSVLYKFLIPK